MRRSVSYIVVIPANTRHKAFSVPVDNIIPISDLGMHTHIPTGRVDAWKTGEPGFFYNARILKLLDALDIKVGNHGDVLYSDFIITGNGCIPLTHGEANSIVKFMNDRN